MYFHCTTSFAFAFTSARFTFRRTRATKAKYEVLRKLRQLYFFWCILLDSVASNIRLQTSFRDRGLGNITYSSSGKTQLSEAETSGGNGKGK